MAGQPYWLIETLAQPGCLQKNLIHLNPQKENYTTARNRNGKIPTYTGWGGILSKARVSHGKLHGCLGYTCISSSESHSKIHSHSPVFRAQLSSLNLNYTLAETNSVYKHRAVSTFDLEGHPTFCHCDVTLSHTNVLSHAQLS